MPLLLQKTAAVCCRKLQLGPTPPLFTVILYLFYCNLLHSEIRNTLDFLKRIRFLRIITITQIKKE